MPKNITRKQQKYLFSSGSPLTKKQKEKLAREMVSGVVSLVPKRKKPKFY